MNILAIGPHPDDIEFGCAPILIQESERGNRIKLLVLSRGEAGSKGTPEGREQEAREASRLMNAEFTLLDFGGDCHIRHTPENSIRIAAEIRSFQPAIILAPSPTTNQHPDHSAVANLARDACRLARYAGLAELKSLPVHSVGALFFYNITQHSRRPDIVVDVSSVVDKWKAVMACHQSQVTNKAYVELQISAARLTGLSAGVEYAVGLHVNDPIRVDGLSAIAISARAF